MKNFIASGEADRTEWFDWEGTAENADQAEAQIRALFADATDVRIESLQEAPVEV